MVSKDDGWVRIFSIPETSKHKGGFTIYKTISMLYPKNCPDSVTKVTVWKRYNDFKKLHRNVRSLCKSLKIKDKCPNLPGTSYFKRFNEEVIHQRLQNVLTFLEFLGSHAQLFASDLCVSFFKTSYTPCDLLNSNIHSIRADLNLPVEADYDLICCNSDDEHTISDTDSISTLSSAIEHLPDPLNLNAHSSTTTVHPVNLLGSRTSSHDSLSISLSTTNASLDGLTITETDEEQVFPTPPHTPRSTTNYILDASHYITQAVDFEILKKFEDAFTSYKTGIDILLKNVKDQTDFDHKEMVRRKVERYLLRAEKIYNIHLSPESKAIQSYSMENEEQEKDLIQQSVSDLYKYKVIRVIGTGMLVMHAESQQLFYIKVINKTSKFATDKLVLPGNVPYMVKLYNYYDCENALFLILEYCSGSKFCDYVQQKTNHDSVFTASCNSDSTYFSNSNLSLHKHDESESDSDHSYSNLIQDYTLSKLSSNVLIGSDENIDSTIQMNVVCDKENQIFNVQSSNAEKNLESKAPKNKMDPGVKLKKSSRNSSEMSEWSSFDDNEIPDDSLLPLEDITKWAAQLLLAIERLHLLGVICCDLQSKNILINESGDLMLTYMCNVIEKYDVAYIETDDLILAPELYNFHPITEAVDWWSYGAILYEWLVGLPLKTGYPKGLSTSSYLKIPRHVTVEGRSLLKQLLIYDAQDRLGCGINGADDIKSHPFFNNVIWDNLHTK